MAMAERTPLWTTEAPSEWPDSPLELTISTLAEIEACPRRWALGAAQYPGLWTGRGYPPRVQLSALAGTVAHLALETITRSLVQAACSSVQDEKAPQVMKALGGYTRVLNGCVDRILQRLTGNPRAAPLLESATRSLRAQVPELRGRVQTILSRMNLAPRKAGPAATRESKVHAPLTVGAYTEIELRATHIGWRGKADLLVLSDDICEITDFKTGAPDDGHRFQIQVYALLWCRDGELNPTGRQADQLVLRYSGEDVHVAAPNGPQLSAIEGDIVVRGTAAQQAGSQRPPEVRPAAENCRHCGVRHLCDGYWTSRTQRNLAPHVDGHRFGDAEVTITGRHGSSSWDAMVQLSAHVAADTSAVVRTHGDSEFRVGDHLRIIDVAVTVGDDEQPAVFTLSALSEVYVVPSGGTITRAP